MFVSFALKTIKDYSLSYPFLQFIYKSPKPLPLGRWCHQSSDIYKDTCKPNKKAHLANIDNSFNK